MSSLLQDKTFLIIATLLLLVLGINVGIEIYPMLNDNSMPRCTSGTIQERTEKLESTDDPSVRKVMKYYTIECSDGTLQEVRAFKNFPIGTTISLQWVKQ